MNQKQKAVQRAIDRAIAICGNQAELARRSGETDQRINNAYRRGSVSPELAESLAKGTGGLMSRDLFVWGDTEKAAA